MNGAIVILVFTVIVGVILWLIDKKQRKNSCPMAEEKPEGECCGMHDVCEKQFLSPVSADIEYYDDEELDRFKNRDPESYTDAETEEFRDVLLSLREEDVPGWSKSLQLREIQLPQDVKDELLMIVAESRKNSQSRV